MTSPDDAPQVIVVGAGLAGCLVSLLLARQGCCVRVYERRCDPTGASDSTKDRGRSINLAISTRGLTALDQAGLVEKVRKLAVPMHGRCIHDAEGNTRYQRYGTEGQCLLSVPRTALNALLVKECKQSSGICLTFGARCIEVDVAGGKCTVQSEDGVVTTDEAHLIVGADGMWSRVRGALMRTAGFNYSHEYIDAAYKEIRLDSPSVDQAWHNEWLHIWPRKRFMLIALPNSADSDAGAYTCTLFMDRTRFDQLETEEQVENFLRTEFPDAYTAMCKCTAEVSVGKEFLSSPTPPLLTVRCAPYHAGRTVLIGDAAHAMVPFYGQGTQAAFEDARVLSELVVEHGVEEALSKYTQARKPNADAIADLSLDNYQDMAARSARPLIMLGRRLGIVFGKVFPRWKPLYGMVAFSNIPYAKAVARARMQDRIAALATATAVIGTVTACGVAYARIGKTIHK